MTKRVNVSYRIFFIGLLALVLSCPLAGNICNWIMVWCNSLVSNKQMPFAIILLMVFVFTIISQIWKTHRATQSVFHIIRVNFPKHIRDVIADLEIDIAKITLIESPVPIAFCFGFISPRICLSTGLIDLLSTSQLRAALCHEDFHRQRFDPLRILFIEAVSTALFFLPAVREWRSLVKIKLELDADEYAALKVGKPALAGALHRLLTHPSKSRLVLNGAAFVGLSATTARITALLEEDKAPQKISRRNIVVSILIIWVLCIILML